MGATHLFVVDMVDICIVKLGTCAIATTIGEESSFCIVSNFNLQCMTTRGIADDMVWGLSEPVEESHSDYPFLLLLGQRVGEP